MFKLNQAALLFIELLVMCHVFEEMLQNENRAMMVPRGDSVTLTCNISKTNATQISWTNKRSVFQYSIELNRTYSNFSLHRLKINHEFPTKLIIFSSQPEDEGIYTCSITDKSGLHSITWNLTVSESPKESISSQYFLYIFPPAIGFLLCGITLAVFLYRKMMMRTLNQDPAQDQFPPNSGDQVAFSQPQGGTAHCTNNKQSRQYMERLNLIYGHY
ncbi:deoxyribonuclease-1-like protein [Sarotherodon galilaeus]